MKSGKFNVIIDAAWGSSGKGKMSTWLSWLFGIKHVSSSNFPNAGHTAVLPDGRKFVAKAIPTSAILNSMTNPMEVWISPGSGFSWTRLLSEWSETSNPRTHIHARASIVTDDHAARERSGADSVMHIASTMQGSGAAMVDKILRRAGCELARDRAHIPDGITVEDGQSFRDGVRSVLDGGHVWMHEGSQGYALSIDHGSDYPFCTSRNCTVQSAMDQMAVPPQLLGDVYLNLRSFPIRVGNVFVDGVQTGYSGGWYKDCQETTWEAVGIGAGMPQDEIAALSARELTTVTKRLRRVANFSFIGLKDAVLTNGATKLCLNFAQYIDWNDRGRSGTSFDVLSIKTRRLIQEIEDAALVPVVAVGTGPSMHDVVYKEDLI